MNILSQNMSSETVLLAYGTHRVSESLLADNDPIWS